MLSQPAQNASGAVRDARRDADVDPFLSQIGRAVVEVVLFADLDLDYIGFYVQNVTTAAEGLINQYGFAPSGTSGDPNGATGQYSLALGQGEISIVLTQGHRDDHPAAIHVNLHGDGIANIAFRVADAHAAFATALARGARAVAEPAEVPEPNGGVMATIAGFGDVVHTFTQRRTDDPALPPPGLAPIPWPAGRPGERLRRIDHFAVCVDPGQLEPTADFYRGALDFREIFAERIVLGSQAMLSKVVQSASGGITLTIVAPDPGAEPGQIDDFLKDNAGPGVQHVAFDVDNLVETVGALRERGVGFLGAPRSYYMALARRLTPVRYTIDELQAHDILLDEDPDGQLLQIFSRSTHPRGTFFFELIERFGARTFGSGNIKALYEAVELERVASKAGSRAASNG